MSELYQRLIPYRSHKRALQFDAIEDYEMAVLRLLAGERGYATLEPSDAQEALAVEAEAVNPNPGAFRDFAAATVRLTQTAVRALRDEHAAYAPPGYTPPGASPAPPEPEPEPTVETRGPPDEGPAPLASTEPEALKPVGAPEPREPAGEEPEADDARPPQEPAEPAFDKQLVFEAVEEGPSCAYCGATLPADRHAIFCPYCGERVEQLRCSQCGEPLEPDWRFCLACGEPVGH